MDSNTATNEGWSAKKWYNDAIDAYSRYKQGDTADWENIKNGSTYQYFKDKLAQNGAVTSANQKWTTEDANQYRYNANKSAYEKEKQRLKDDYATNVASNPLKWLANGISGGGWGETSYLNKHGYNSDTDQYAGLQGASDWQNQTKAYQQARQADLDQGRNLYSGLSLIGALNGGTWSPSIIDSSFISSGTQALSGLSDLLTSGTQKWDEGKRSVTSDIGNLIDLGTDAFGTKILGNLLGGTASSLGKTALQSGITGAISGGANMMNQGGDDVNPGEVVLGSLLGGALGTALGSAGYGINALKNKAATSKIGDYVADSNTTMSSKTNAGLNQEMADILSGKNLSNDTYSKELISDLKDIATGKMTVSDMSSDTYQELLQAYMKDAGIENPMDLTDAIDVLGTRQTSQSYNPLKGKTAQNAAAKQAKQTLKDLYKEYGVAKTGIGQDIQGAKAYLNDWANTSKVGNKVVNLLKSKGTKTAAKVAGAFGAGTLISNLLKGDGSLDTSDMTADEAYQMLYYYGDQLDEETQLKLYNKIYGGE